MIFVFGSNEGGEHGAGAAKFALDKKGAIWGYPYGPAGESFAIPTKDISIRNTLSLGLIRLYVEGFIYYAKHCPKVTFQVTRIGCGLAGLKDEQIAPMFEDAPPNCQFDDMWRSWLEDKHSRSSRKFWGTF